MTNYSHFILVNLYFFIYLFNFIYLINFLIFCKQFTWIFWLIIKKNIILYWFHIYWLLFKKYIFDIQIMIKMYYK